MPGLDVTKQAPRHLGIMESESFCPASPVHGKYPIQHPDKSPLSFFLICQDWKAENTPPQTPYIGCVI